MTGLQSSGTAVWPYVLVGVLVKIVCAGLIYWYATTTARDPNISSHTVTILAVVAGIGWYSYRINRPMQPREMIKFATGIALADLILSFMVIAAPILWVGEDISMRSIGLVWGGKEGLTTQDIVPLGIVILVAELLVFAPSVFFAWIMTRRLPMRRKGTLRGR